MTRISLFAAALAAAFAFADSAAAEPVLVDMTQLTDAGLDLIAEDHAAGRISDAEAAVETFYRLMRPEESAARYALGGLTGEPVCGTSLIAELNSRWDELTPRQRHHVAETTDPLYKNWIDAGGITWLDGDVHAAQAAQRSTCFSPEDLDFSRYENQTRSGNDYFEIHWNEGGNVTEQRIGWMAEWFDTAFQVEVNELGFFAPTNITSYQLLVIVERLGGGVFGYTGLAQCGFEYMPYIVMNAAELDDQVGLRPTAAHELFHAIQQVYGFEEFWLSRERPNGWFLEASAVYAASITNPFDAQRHGLHAIRWAIEPYKSMTTHDAAGFQYGMVVWPFSLGKTLIDPVWHRDFWESIRDESGYLLRDRFDEFLEERDSSFLEEYRKFVRDAATGAQSDYASGVIYASQFSEDALTGEHDEGDYPVEVTVDGDHRRERPQYLGQNYVFFDSDDVDRDRALHLEVWVDGEKSDTLIEWIGEVIALEDDEVASTHSLEWEGDDFGDDGEPRTWRASVVFNDFRSSSDGVLLGVSPIVDFGDGGATWGYTATLIDETGDPGFGEAPADEDDDDDDDGQACGASAAAAPRAPGVGVLALALAATVRRRRRS